MSRQARARAVTEALKKISKNQPGHSFNELRVVVALERAVARLERHPRLKSHLIFKGGFVLLKTIETQRFTRDVDALAFEISKQDVPQHVLDALSQDLDDGVWFGDVQVKDLVDQGAYGGIRFDCAYQLGEPPHEVEKIKKLSRVHIDVGFGDELTEPPRKDEMSSILSIFDPISWKVYPFETILAEKLETVLSRASANSRAKDIYDLVLLFSRCSNASQVWNSIKATFDARGTAIPSSFFEAAKQIDLRQLRVSWPGLQLGEQELFDKYWLMLLGRLKDLDSQLIPRG